MKIHKNFTRVVFITLVLSIFTISCKEDDKFKDQMSPQIELKNNSLEGLPGDVIKILAKVTDDSGIKNIKVESFDWEFVYDIPFSKQNYIREYDLSQMITIPSDAKRGSNATVDIIVTDHANNKVKVSLAILVTQEPAKLEIKQDMGVSIVINGKNAVVENNNVTFVDQPNLKWDAQFVLTSNRTKLVAFKAECPTLNLNETIDLTTIPTEDDGKTIRYNASYSLNGSVNQHDLVFTLTDEEGMKTTYTPTISIKSTFANVNHKHLKMFMMDNHVELSKVVYGLPMLGEQKADNSYKFTMKYYSPKENTPLVLLSDRTTTASKYGLSNDGQYIINSKNPNPIVLPKKGYYQITIDLLLGSCSVTEISSDAPAHPYPTEMYLAGSGNGLGYDGNHPMIQVEGTRLFRRSHDFKNEGGCIAFGIGNGIWLVAAGGRGNWDPEVWGTKEDLAGMQIYDTEIDPSRGLIEITFDPYLYRSYAISK